VAAGLLPETAMLIAVDAMGGDYAPDEIVKGAFAFATRKNVQIALVGKPEVLDEVAGRYGPMPHNVTIKPASQVITMGESPTAALHSKRDSSLAVAVQMVRDKQAAAVMSAGNSGAFLALAHLCLRPVQGVLRPAIGVVLPGSQQPWILIDGGANVECKPIHLAQFGVIASIYCEYALGRKQPKVGILSIGEEQGKGSELVLATHELLAEAPVNFIGNVEGDELFSGQVDVVVADGFTGNVALKVAEGMAHFVLGEVRQQIARSLVAKLGALLMRGAFKHLREFFDYSTYGGALLLGVNGICVVGHGRSDARAVTNALQVAYRAVQGRVVEHISTAVAQLQDTATVHQPAGTTNNCMKR